MCIRDRCTYGVIRISSRNGPGNESIEGYVTVKCVTVFACDILNCGAMVCKNQTKVTKEKQAISYSNKSVVHRIGDVQTNS